MTRPLDSELSLEMFVPLSGDIFRVTIAEAEHTVRLREVESLARADGAKRTAGGREPFRLLFEITSERNHAQGTYTFTHPTIGAHEIFVVPVEREGAQLLLEAVFM